MSDNILAVIKIYIFAYVCLVFSSFGLFLLNEDISLLAVSLLTIISPIALLINVFYVAIIEAKND